jgi:hypothetical protein
MDKEIQNEPKLKCWLKLHEVLKQYKTSNKEIIKLVSCNEIQVTVVSDEVWFFRGNLESKLTKK